MEPQGGQQEGHEQHKAHRTGLHQYAGELVVGIEAFQHIVVVINIGNPGQTGRGAEGAVAGAEYRVVFPDAEGQIHGKQAAVVFLGVQFVVADFVKAVGGVHLQRILDVLDDGIFPLGTFPIHILIQQGGLLFGRECLELFQQFAALMGEHILLVVHKDDGAVFL